MLDQSVFFGFYTWKYVLCPLLCKRTFTSTFFSSYSRQEIFPAWPLPLLPPCSISHPGVNHLLQKANEGSSQFYNNYYISTGKYFTYLKFVVILATLFQNSFKFTKLDAKNDSNLIPHIPYFLSFCSDLMSSFWPIFQFG